MLLLHSRLIVVFAALTYGILGVSCSNRSNPNSDIIKSLQESIESSNNSILKSNQEVLASLQDKQFHRSTMIKAKYWYSKALLVQNVSTETFEYIEILKGKIRTEDVNIKTIANDLFRILTLYKNKLLEVDSIIAPSFEKSFALLTSWTDSAKGDQSKLYERYFKNAHGVSAVAILTRLQNNVRIDEGNMINYFHDQTGKVSLGPCSPDLPIAVQSSTVVQPGEKIEITTGICSFYVEIEPEVFVFDRLVPIGPDGVARSSIKSASVPGRYYVPVRVKYIDQNGKTWNVQKELQYTVANIQKQ